MFPHVISDDRQADATHLLIDVECIDIGHAANIVDHGHEARLQVGTLYLILAAEAADDLLGVEAVGIDGGVDQRLHQRLHELIATQLHIQHGLALIDLLVGEPGAAAVGLAHRWLYVVDQTALKRAVENLPLVADEGLHTLMLQLVHGTSPHINHLLVLVGDTLVGNALENLLLLGSVEESQKGPACLFKAENLQFVGVLYVHDLIADVVGGLHEIYQRMPGKAERLAFGRELTDAQLAGYGLITTQLTMEETELSMVAGLLRHEGIFHDTCQHGIGHQESPRPSAEEMMGEQPEGVGVALKVGDVAPKFGRYFAAQHGTLALGEKSLYGLLARMAKRRITHVVGQTGRGDDSTDLFKERSAEFGVNHHEPAGDVVAQGMSHGGDFQRMGQPVMHKDAAREGKHLGLVLHPSKGSGEDQTVVISLELGSFLVHLRMAVLLSESLI